MQLKKQTFTFFKIAIYKAASLLLLFGSFFLIDSLIGESSKFNSLGLFGLFFLLVFIGGGAFLWAVIHFIALKVSNQFRHALGITGLWIIFYFIFFSLSAKEGFPSETTWYTPQVTTKTILNLLKTIPAFAIFLILFRKDPLQKLISNKENADKAKGVLDSNIPQKLP